MVDSRFMVFSAMCFIGFIIGWFVASYGPLIPFYSRETGLDETHYSYVMMCRSIGIIAGLFAAKYLPNHFQTKAILIYSMLMSSLSFFINTLSLSDTNLLITGILMSAHSIIGNAMGFGVIFQLYPANEAAYYIQIRGFMSGVGTLIGANLIGWLQLNNYIYLAISHIYPLAIFIIYTIPNIQTKAESAKSNKPTISGTSQLMICTLMLVYAGMETGLANWMPTYAIKAGVTDTEGSSFYSLLFWVPSCAGRFLWLYAPGNMITRLSFIMKTMIVVTSVALLMQFMEMYQLLCIFTSVVSGLLMSNIYLFYISLPVDHGFEPTSNNTAHIMLAHALGEGVINMPTGYLMRVFSFKVLMVLQVLFAVISMRLVTMLHSRFEQQLEEAKNRLIQQKDQQT